jgi:acetyl-CoA acetyltransferase
MVGLLSDLRLDEFGQVAQRLLPAQVTGLDWNDIWQAFLHDIDFRAERDPLQCHRHSNLSGQVRVLELVGVAQALVGHELNVLATERVALAGGEIAKGHSVGATGCRVL